jgi:hypothetical protein
MSTLSEPQLLWAVVDVFVEQLSVPPVVAQTIGPQKHQQRPTQLPCQHRVSRSVCGPLYSNVE